jgi:hypothetical protein
MPERPLDRQTLAAVLRAHLGQRRLWRRCTKQRDAWDAALRVTRRLKPDRRGAL